jgi:hypothetical protein
MGNSAWSKRGLMIVMGATRPANGDQALQILGTARLESPHRWSCRTMVPHPSCAGIEQSKNARRE